MIANQPVFQVYVASTPIDFRKGPTRITISTIPLATASNCAAFTARPRAPESGATIPEARLAPWVATPVRARDRRHVRPWRKRFPDNPIVLVLRPVAV